jgi:RND family efflux transporter MFP subunit
LVDSVLVEFESGYEAEDRFVGRVEAARASDLGFELAGTVASLGVDDGHQVEAGQVLAELDVARLNARRSEVAAGVAEAAATLELATLTADRMAAAQASNAVSKQQLDESQEAQISSVASLQRMNAQLEAIDVDLAKSKLVAPFSGTISVRHVDEGTIVDTGRPIFHLLETGRLEIRAGLSSRAVAGFSKGKSIIVRTASGDEVAAVVARLLPQRDSRTRTVDVILEPEGEGTSLRDGDLVDVPVKRRIEGLGFWLPRTALTESVRGLWAAYVLVPDEQADLFRLERRQLEVLEESGERVFVRGAIVSGERVAAKGLQRLGAGQQVRSGVASQTGTALTKG